jgi:hypothetical protein
LWLKIQAGSETAMGGSKRPGKTLLKAHMPPIKYLLGKRLANCFRSCRLAFSDQRHTCSSMPSVIMIKLPTHFSILRKSTLSIPLRSISIPDCGAMCTDARKLEEKSHMESLQSMQRTAVLPLTRKLYSSTASMESLTNPSVYSHSSRHCGHTLKLSALATEDSLESVQM